MSKISPCLWFNNEAEEAANFYVSLLPNSGINRVLRNVMDSPAGKAGTVLVVDFTIAGQTFQALNGNSKPLYTQALSLSVDCADQAEVDRVWNKLLEGGSPVQCGWITDRYGVSWQVVPSIMSKLLADPDHAKAQRVMEAMMGMVKLDIAGLQAAYAGKSAA
jgi:predicted 3-demethylubiquinone-9 3-methyltransferase (glyoxalase superfamily)